MTHPRSGVSLRLGWGYAPTVLLHKFIELYRGEAPHHAGAWFSIYITLTY